MKTDDDSEDTAMTLTERITQVLQQRKIMQEQLRDRRKLSRARLEAVAQNPSSDNDRVLVFSAHKRIEHT